MSKIQNIPKIYSRDPTKEGMGVPRFAKEKHIILHVGFNRNIK